MRAAAGIFAATTIYSAAAVADNPIVQTSYTADPAPMVHDGRLYVYTSHDEDVTVNNFFTMNDWRVYSTVDMVNWTDHGSPAGYKTFSWGTGDAWAIQVVVKSGKFYLYAPINNSTGSKIGVAVAQSPTGPFTDPLGKALISTGSGNIDPTVFIDDDGQAYLYWGNPDLYNVKLNADMISFPGSPTKVSLTTAGFGVRSKTDRATAYEEGPWFYKRDSLYYIVYPADSTPEKISYTTSSGPQGPWMYRGDIMAKETGAGGSFTNHPGVVDYKGHSYFFYHNAALPGGGGYKRSVCIEEFTYGSGGTIPEIKMTSYGAESRGEPESVRSRRGRDDRFLGRAQDRGLQRRRDGRHFDQQRRLHQGQERQLRQRCHLLRRAHRFSDQRRKHRAAPRQPNRHAPRDLRGLRDRRRADLDDQELHGQRRDWRSRSVSEVHRRQR